MYWKFLRLKFPTFPFIVLSSIQTDLKDEYRNKKWTFKIVGWNQLVADPSIPEWLPAPAVFQR